MLCRAGFPNHASSENEITFEADGKLGEPGYESLVPSAGGIPFGAPGGRALPVLSHRSPFYGEEGDAAESWIINPTCGVNMRPSPLPVGWWRTNDGRSRISCCAWIARHGRSP